MEDLEKELKQLQIRYDALLKNRNDLVKSIYDIKEYIINKGSELIKANNGVLDENTMRCLEICTSAIDYIDDLMLMY